MGITHSKRGGTNKLPPEIFAKIGQYADRDTRTRMRRTGKYGFMVPLTYGPQIEEFLQHRPEHLVRYLLENDTPTSKRLFEKIILTFAKLPPMLYPLSDGREMLTTCYGLNEFINEQIQEAVQVLDQTPIGRHLRLDDYYVLDLDKFEKYSETIHWMYVTMDQLCNMKTYLMKNVQGLYENVCDAWFLKTIFGLDISPKKRKKREKYVSNKRPRTQFG